MYAPGDCIIIETNLYEDGSSKAHLFIVILEAIHDSDRTILVPLSTIRQGRYYDQTVTLIPGDHDFVVDPSYVDYRDAIIETKSTLDEMIRLKRSRMRNPKLGNDLLQKIRDGIRRSRETPFYISAFYDDYLFSQL